MAPLDDCTSNFSKLHTASGRDYYPALTHQRAPHKSFLLLSAMDLVFQE
jgi:hypothetical protein